MDITRRLARTAVIVIAILTQITGASLKAQAPDALLKGTTWLCTVQVGDGKMRKGYMYLSPSAGVKVAEIDRSPNLDGMWWPRIEDVPKDLEETEPQLRWEATRDHVRIYYHPDRSMYVAARAAGKMWIGTVPLEQADPDTFFKEQICQGLIISRAGACPSLFDYRIDEPDDKVMVCEQRSGWLK